MDPTFVSRQVGEFCCTKEQLKSVVWPFLKVGVATRPLSLTHLWLLYGKRLSQELQAFVK